MPTGTSHVPSAPCAPPPWAGCSCKHLQCPESPGGFPKHLLIPKASPSQQPVRRIWAWGGIRLGMPVDWEA